MRININEFLLYSISAALITCGVGIFLPFHTNFHFADWSLYRYLFLIILANLLFVVLKRYSYSKAYTITSLVLSALMFFLETRVNYIFSFKVFPFVISGIFVTGFIVLFLVRANWNIVFLMNCVLIFIYVNWLGLSYVNPLSSHIPTLSGMIKHNVNGMFNLRGIGYFISNIGIIIALVTGILSTILVRRNKG